MRSKTGMISRGAFTRLATPPVTMSASSKMFFSDLALVLHSYDMDYRNVGFLRPAELGQAERTPKAAAEYEERGKDPKVAAIRRSKIPKKKQAGRGALYDSGSESE